jgi:uncharacterized protein (DUF427 family)
MTVRAVWNGTVLAESDDTVVVEGNHYFPPESLRREHFTPSRLRTLCFWKGLASYYTITAGGVSRPHGAWYYPHPIPLARRIRNRVAFAADIEVVELSSDSNGL